MAQYGEWLHPSDPLFWRPEEYNPRHFKVRDKETGQIVPFQLWDHQRYMAAKLVEAYAARKWIAMVKPRKLGSSTFWTAEITKHACYLEGCFAKIVAQRREVAQELADCTMRFHQYLPGPFKPEKKVGKKRSLELPQLDSKVDIAAVTQDDPGRGSTGINALLATEICKWGERADEKWSSLLANVPLERGFAIAESTPLYNGDPLNRLYEKSLEPDSKWMSLFIPWTQVREYAVEPPPHWEPSVVVADYATKYRLTPQQAYWMSVKGLQDTAGRLDLFRAEYPIDIVDCWLPGGDAMFDTDRLWTMKQDIDGGTGLVAEQTPWCYYEDPNVEGSKTKGDRYLVTCDPAGSFSERDMWGIEVLNITKCSQAVEYQGYGNAFEMAKTLADLGRKYNNATVYVESNGVGDAVLSHLAVLGYPYVFCRSGNKPGFHTSKTSKAQAIGFLQELIRDGSLKLRSKRCIDQLMNYRGQWDGIGGRDIKGGHYDLVAALAIAAWAWHEEGGGTKASMAYREQGDWRQAINDYMARLDRISNGAGPGVETPWGRHI